MRAVPHGRLALETKEKRIEEAARERSSASVADHLCPCPNPQNSFGCDALWCGCCAAARINCSRAQSESVRSARRAASTSTAFSSSRRRMRIFPVRVFSIFPSVSCAAIQFTCASKRRQRMRCRRKSRSGRSNLSERRLQVRRGRAQSASKPTSRILPWLEAAVTAALIVSA